jgi:hypothetical protein
MLPDGLIFGWVTQITTEKISFWKTCSNNSKVVNLKQKTGK